ncbi:MAG: transcriptional regulator [Thaumarchaeota archaeon]|nr:transcriptional regulator [Nitrososphaerota archaeon]
MKRREPVLIYMEMLATLYSGPRGPTRLAQACNMNYGRLDAYAQPLLKKGLIRAEEAGGQQTLYITDEGCRVYRDWLEIWRRLPLELT